MEEKLKKGEKYDSYKFRILDLLKEKGPLRLYEMEGQLKIPRPSLVDCLSTLMAKGWVKRLEDGRYALFTYKELEREVEEVIKKFKERGFVEISINDVAYHITQPPEDIRRLVYDCAKKYKLKVGAKSVRPVILG